MIWIQAYYLAKIYQESSLPLQETGKVGKDCSVRAVGQKERDLGKAIIIELKIVFRYATIQPQPSNAIHYHVFITANEHIPIKRFHANLEYFILRLFALSTALKGKYIIYIYTPLIHVQTFCAT